MAERKTLTITQVNEIQKVGDNQIPKLSFKVKGGEEKHSYFTFRPRLFELIKEGQTINADVETEIKGEWTNHKVVQIYVGGQPVAVRKEGYRGKSPEELELSRKSYALSYSKDLAVADKITITVADKITIAEIIKWADIFYSWLKGKEQPKQTTQESDELFELTHEEESPKAPTGKKVQNITEFKGLMAKHKIGTHEAYEILSINSLMKLTDLDEAWAQVKEAKGIKEEK